MGARAAGGSVGPTTGHGDMIPAVSAPRSRPGSMSPARVVALVAATVLAVGTAALMLPISSRSGSTHFVDALFTAVSALCVTGLTVLDTQSHWSLTGVVVIAVLIQIGGLGVMTLATMLGMVAARRLGLRSRVVSSVENRGQIAEVGMVMRNILLTSLAVESVVAAMLFLRFWLGHEMDWAAALGHAVFHAVSAFNNAGFALFEGNMTPYAEDALILLPLTLAVILGGLGFPVITELLRRVHLPRKLSLTAKIVLIVTPILLIAGTAATLLLEHDNPGTLGPMGWGGKILNAFFHSTVSRTAGFNAVDTGAMQPQTWLITDLLMLVGGGSAGTAGGLKITTVVVLLAIVRSELRGDPYVLVLGKRLSRAQHREVITIVVLMVGAIMAATVTLMMLGEGTLDSCLFEAVSAATTTGLSTGITGGLSDISKVVLSMLMFAGRVGPTTLGAALALRRRPLLYEPAKERLLIG